MRCPQRPASVNSVRPNAGNSIAAFQRVGYGQRRPKLHCQAAGAKIRHLQPAGASQPIIARNVFNERICQQDALLRLLQPIVYLLG